MNLQEFIDNIKCPICNKPLIHKSNQILWFNDSSEAYKVHIISNQIFYENYLTTLGIFPLVRFTPPINIMIFCLTPTHQFYRDFFLTLEKDSTFINAEIIYSKVTFVKEDIMLESFNPSNFSRINLYIKFPFIPFVNITADKLKRYMILS